MGCERGEERLKQGRLYALQGDRCGCPGCKSEERCKQDGKRRRKWGFYWRVPESFIELLQVDVSKVICEAGGYSGVVGAVDSSQYVYCTKLK